MLESIPARGWRRVSLVVLVVACIAVVVIGQRYGSEPRRVAPLPRHSLSTASGPSQQQAGCSLLWRSASSARSSSRYITMVRHQTHPS